MSTGNGKDPSLYMVHSTLPQVTLSEAWRGRLSLLSARPVVTSQLQSITDLLSDKKHDMYEWLAQNCYPTVRGWELNPQPPGYESDKLQNDHRRLITVCICGHIQRSSTILLQSILWHKITFPGQTFPCIAPNTWSSLLTLWQLLTHWQLLNVG